MNVTDLEAAAAKRLDQLPSQAELDEAMKSANADETAFASLVAEARRLSAETTAASSWTEAQEAAHDAALQILDSEIEVTRDRLTGASADEAVFARKVDCEEGAVLCYRGCLGLGDPTLVRACMRDCFEAQIICKLGNWGGILGALADKLVKVEGPGGGGREA